MLNEMNTDTIQNITDYKKLHEIIFAMIGEKEKLSSMHANDIKSEHIIYCENKSLERDEKCIKSAKLSAICDSSSENGLVEKKDQNSPRALRISKPSRFDELLDESSQNITKLLEEKKVLISMFESYKIKSHERVRKLKDNLKDNIEKHNSQVIQVEEERKEIRARVQAMDGTIKSLEAEKDSLKADYKGIALQNEKNKETIKTITQENTQMKELLKNHNEMIIEVNELRSKVKLLEENSNKMVAQYQSIEHQLANEVNTGNRMKELIREKDMVISKLKETIQEQLKSDQVLQEEKESLQNEICILTQKFAEIASNGDSSKSPVLSTIEEEKQNIENQQKSSQVSMEIMQKNRQLSLMMEKSNRMYTSLKQEYDALIKEHQKISSFNQYHEMKYVCNTSITIPQNEHGMNNDATMAYLRRVFIQFLTENGTSKISILPPILELIGCSKDQIAIIIRQYERSQSFLSRTSNFFFNR